MVLKMSTDKSSLDTPTYIVTGDTAACNEKQANVGLRYKKQIVIAVAAVISVGLIVAAVLIGIHISTEAQKDIVQFQLQFKGSDNQNVQQDVTSDPNENVVIYHVTKADQDAYIVDDFNKGIQTVRILSSAGTTCYVTPLNQSTAMDPSAITGPESMSGSTRTSGQPFLLSNTPVVDRSFMTKKAADLCTGVSVYWAYRACGALPADPSNTTLPSDRSKRQIYTFSNYNGLPCLGACCRVYCACQVLITEKINGNVHQCTYAVRTGTCCPPQGSVQQPYCSNYYYGTWPTPGQTGTDCHY